YVFHRGRIHLRSTSELEAVQPERIWRHQRWRGHSVLCIYRLRRGLDRGRRNQKSPAQLADRDYRFVDHMHYLLRSGCLRLYWTDLVPRLESEARNRASRTVDHGFATCWPAV